MTCELWAVEYPGEKAGPSAVPMQQLRGGRIVKAIPNYTNALAMVSLLEALESDAAWLDKVAEVAVDEKQLDPNREAVWETSEEGREALDRRRQRDRKRLEQTMGPRTGWGDPDWRESASSPSAPAASASGHATAATARRAARSGAATATTSGSEETASIGVG